MSQQKWDKLYKDFGRIDLKPHPSLYKVIDYFNHYRIKNVLEIGSGSGRNLVALADKGFMVTGVEYSPAAASLSEKWLKERGLVGKVYVANLLDRFEFIDEAHYEAVVAVDVLEYLDKSNFIKLLKEVNRVLKTGGVFHALLSFKAKDGIEIYQYDQEFIKKTIEEKFRVLHLTQEKSGEIVLIAQEK